MKPIETPGRVKRMTCALLAMLCSACATSAVADAAAEKKDSLQKLRAAITRKIITSCGVTPKQPAAMKVMLQNNGYLEGVLLVQSSGSAAFDSALMTAISSAQPYRLPRDPVARNELLTLDIKFDADASVLPPCR